MQAEPYLAQEAKEFENTELAITHSGQCKKAKPNLKSATTTIPAPAPAPRLHGTSDTSHHTAQHRPQDENKYARTIYCSTTSTFMPEEVVLSHG